MYSVILLKFFIKMHQFISQLLINSAAYLLPMDCSAKYLIFLVLCLVLSEYEADDKYQTNLSRKRRYVVFPEGSTFSVSIAQYCNLCDYQLNSERYYYS